MTGQQVRKKIKEKGITFRYIADKMGIPLQNFLQFLQSDNLKTGTLEEIAQIIQVNVAYFYDQESGTTMVEYAECQALRKENALLKQLLTDKEEIIRLLKSKEE